MADKTTTVPAVYTENLTKVYSPRHLAVNHVSLQLEPGTVLGILGPNGAGKTTLVKLLIGLQRPTSGRVSSLDAAWGRMPVCSASGLDTCLPTCDFPKTPRRLTILTMWGDFQGCYEPRGPASGFCCEPPI